MMRKASRGAQGGGDRVIRFRFRQKLAAVAAAIDYPKLDVGDDLLEKYVELESRSRRGEDLPKVRFALFHLPPVSRLVLCAILLEWPHQDRRVCRRLGMPPLEYLVRRLEMLEDLRRFAARLGSKRFDAEVGRFARELEAAEQGEGDGRAEAGRRT